MREDKKGYVHQADDGPKEGDDPDKRKPSPDDPSEEIGMPPKEMPAKDHPHDEEITDYDFVKNYDFITR